VISRRSQGCSRIPLVSRFLNLLVDVLRIRSVLPPCGDKVSTAYNQRAYFWSLLHNIAACCSGCYMNVLMRIWTSWYNHILDTKLINIKRNVRNAAIYTKKESMPMFPPRCTVNSHSLMVYDYRMWFRPMLLQFYFFPSIFLWFSSNAISTAV